MRVAKSQHAPVASPFMPPLDVSQRRRRENSTAISVHAKYTHLYLAHEQSLLRACTRTVRGLSSWRMCSLLREEAQMKGG